MANQAKIITAFQWGGGKYFPNLIRFVLNVLPFLFIRVSLSCFSSECTLSETNQLFNIPHNYVGTCILLNHAPKSVINLKQYRLLLMEKNKPVVIHSFILLQNPSIIPQHLLAYLWLGGGGQLFKCDRWSLVSGCCCCCFRLWPSRPQRTLDEPEPQCSSAENPFAAIQSVFRSRASKSLLPDFFSFFFLWIADFV